jgi:hypothetical protein
MNLILAAFLCSCLAVLFRWKIVPYAEGNKKHEKDEGKPRPGRLVLLPFLEWGCRLFISASIALWLFISYVLSFELFGGATSAQIGHTIETLEWLHKALSHAEVYISIGCVGLALLAIAISLRRSPRLMRVGRKIERRWDSLYQYSHRHGIWQSMPKGFSPHASLLGIEWVGARLEESNVDLPYGSERRARFYFFQKELKKIERILVNLRSEQQKPTKLSGWLTSPTYRRSLAAVSPTLTYLGIALFVLASIGYPTRAWAHPCDNRIVRLRDFQVAAANKEADDAFESAREAINAGRDDEHLDDERTHYVATQISPTPTPQLSEQEKRQIHQAAQSLTRNAIRSTIPSDGPPPPPSDSWKIRSVLARDSVIRADAPNAPANPGSGPSKDNSDVGPMPSNEEGNASFRVEKSPSPAKAQGINEIESEAIDAAQDPPDDYGLVESKIVSEVEPAMQDWYEKLSPEGKSKFLIIQWERVESSRATEIRLILIEHVMKVGGTAGLSHFPCGSFLADPLSEAGTPFVRSVLSRVKREVVRLFKKFPTDEVLAAAYDSPDSPTMPPSMQDDLKRLGDDLDNEISYPDICQKLDLQPPSINGTSEVDPTDKSDAKTTYEDIVPGIFGAETKTPLGMDEKAGLSDDDAQFYPVEPIYWLDAVSSPGWGGPTVEANINESNIKFRRARDYGALEGFSRVGGVLVGKDPVASSAHPDIVGLEWKIIAANGERAIELQVEFKNGHEASYGPFRTRILNQALVYAADGRPLAATMVDVGEKPRPDGRGLKILLHPALAHTRLGDAMYLLDTLADDFSAPKSRLADSSIAQTRSIAMYEVVWQEFCYEAAIKRRDRNGVSDAATVLELSDEQRADIKKAAAAIEDPDSSPFTHFAGAGLFDKDAITDVAGFGQFNNPADILDYADSRTLLNLPLVIWSGVRECDYQLTPELDWLAKPSSGQPPDLNNLYFTLVATPVWNNRDRNLYAPWEFPAFQRQSQFDKRIKDIISAYLRLGKSQFRDDVRDALLELAEFVPLERFFHCAFGGQLGFEFPLQQLPKLARETAADVHRDGKTPQWQNPTSQTGAQGD